MRNFPYGALNGSIYIIQRMTDVRRGYSSGVEHSTADREVPGSIPGVPLVFQNAQKSFEYLLIFSAEIKINSINADSVDKRSTSKCWIDRF